MPLQLPKGFTLINLRTVFLHLGTFIPEFRFLKASRVDTGAKSHSLSLPSILASLTGSHVVTPAAETECALCGVLEPR